MRRATPVSRRDAQDERELLLAACFRGNLHAVEQVGEGGGAIEGRGGGGGGDAVAFGDLLGEELAMQPQLLAQLRGGETQKKILVLAQRRRVLAEALDGF